MPESHPGLPPLPPTEGSAPRSVELFDSFTKAIGIVTLLTTVQQTALTADALVWIDAYRRAVSRLGEALFGWLDIAWLGVSEAEFHALTLATFYVGSSLRSRFVLDPTGASALGNATYRGAQWRRPSRRETLRWLLTILLPLVLAAILLPDPAGWAFVSAIIAVLFFRRWYGHSPDERRPVRFVPSTYGPLWAFPKVEFRRSVAVTLVFVAAVLIIEALAGTGTSSP
ncbi:MAG: hypothetical protein AAGC53_21790 [Actinomycetota bacterium]